MTWDPRMERGRAGGRSPDSFFCCGASESLDWRATESWRQPRRTRPRALKMRPALMHLEVMTSSRQPFDRLRRATMGRRWKMEAWIRGRMRMCRRRRRPLALAWFAAVAKSARRRPNSAALSPFRGSTQARRTVAMSRRRACSSPCGVTTRVTAFPPRALWQGEVSAALSWLRLAGQSWPVRASTFRPNTRFPRRTPGLLSSSFKRVAMHIRVRTVNPAAAKRATASPSTSVARYLTDLAGTDKRTLGRQ